MLRRGLHIRVSKSKRLVIELYKPKISCHFEYVVAKLRYTHCRGVHDLHLDSELLRGQGRHNIDWRVHLVVKADLRLLGTKLLLVGL